MISRIARALALLVATVGTTTSRVYPNACFRCNRIK